MQVITTAQALRIARAELEAAGKDVSFIDNAVQVVRRELKPHALLDHLIAELGLKNDAELARTLKFPPPVISKIRNERLKVGALFILTAHEVTGIPVAKLRQILGPDHKF